MNQQTRISIQGIGKQYWLYNHYGERFSQLLLSPFTHRDYARSFWALQDISLEVKSGETLGIIGVNGSGKSTLLQIMAGVLHPTTGSLRTNGRLTALLELGTGFHPEFTGRENIILSGAALGIPEKEMKKRLDRIIDFAGIGDFIDQPVKHYSSGMYVRLAFSVATSVDPDILIVDEALAVGDTGFVMKCMNRIRQLRSSGTSVVMVTHDIQTVRSLCDTTLWISKGKHVMYGPPLEVSSQYIQSLWEQQDATQKTRNANVLPDQGIVDPPVGQMIDLRNRTDLARWGTGQLRVEGVQVQVEGHPGQSIFEHGCMLQVTVVLRCLKEVITQHLGVGLCIRNLQGLDVITSTTYEAGYRFPSVVKDQQVRVEYRIPNILGPGDYALVLNIEDRSDAMPSYYDIIENAAFFKVVSSTPIYSIVLPEITQTIFLNG